MHTIGEPFIILESIESTNIHAMKLANARLANPGTVFFAKEQYSGKGQRGRQWQSEQGRNIIMSALIEAPSPDPAGSFPLSVVTALACRDLFSRFAGDKTCIKWPNDIVSANWDSLVFDIGDEPLRRIPMMEPLKGTKAMVESLIQRAETPRDLLALLGAGGSSETTYRERDMY